MEETLVEYLKGLGYKVNDKAFAKIKIAYDWYSNVELPFHKRTQINGAEYSLQRTNFSKRLCADDANLCEVIDVVAQKNDSDNKEINQVLDDNNFKSMYRKQLEELSAMGTVGCYLTVEDATEYENGDIFGGKLKLNYANASRIVILSSNNNEIKECAFYGKSHDVKGSKSAINIFKLNGKNYECKTAFFDEDNKLIKEKTYELGEVKPFAIMRVAEVNNMIDMGSYGLPKIFNVVAELMILDLTYNMWIRDLDKADKIVLINKSLCRYNEVTGKYEYPNDEMKKIFVAVSEDNDSEHAMYQEYNPTIRIADVKESLELVLSMLSLRFGFGTKKYTFENGRIVTATEYIGDKQDAMQELNKQREENKNYVEDIIKFVRWYFSKFQNKNFSDDEIEITFDDSYITDKEKELENMKNDALAFGVPQLVRMYFEKRYGLTESESAEWMKAIPGREDGTQLEE